MATDERIKFRGRRVLPDWPATLAAAQQTATYTINGNRLPRIPYGEESDDWNAQSAPCHDCVAVAGELHVPGCDGEQCPSCDGQALTCECEHDDQ